LSVITSVTQRAMIFTTILQYVGMSVWMRVREACGVVQRLWGNEISSYSYLFSNSVSCAVRLTHPGFRATRVVQSFSSALIVGGSLYTTRLRSPYMCAFTTSWQFRTNSFGQQIVATATRIMMSW